MSYSSRSERNLEPISEATKRSPLTKAVIMFTGTFLALILALLALSAKLGSTSPTAQVHLLSGSLEYRPHEVTILALASPLDESRSGNEYDYSGDEKPVSIIANGRIVGHSRPNFVQQLTRRTANALRVILNAALISFPKKIVGILSKVLPFLPRSDVLHDGDTKHSDKSSDAKNSKEAGDASKSLSQKTVTSNKNDDTPSQTITPSSSPKKHHYQPSDPSKINDHNPCDVNLLGLQEDQLKRINDVVHHPILKSKQTRTKARSSQFDVTPHLVYRYLRAVDWVPQYNGRDFHDAIADTVQWRDEFGIASIDTDEIRDYVSKGVAYTGGLDKHGRAIIYLKVGRNDKAEKKNTEIYKRLLMYTVERADRLSETHGSGEFVAVIDLKDFAWSKVPSSSVIKEFMGLLKKHYPYRVGAIIIVNAGLAFNLLWKLFQPILPRKALAKTFVLTKGEMAKKLDESVGMYFLEEAYGGLVKEDHSDVDKYFEQGYWHGKKVSWSINLPLNVA